MIQVKPILIKGHFDDKDFVNFCKRQMEGAARVMHDKLATYPPYKYVSWKSIGGFVSDKQRRFVMANIRKGIIQIPRKRTGTLGRSWSVQERHSADRLVYVIGSNSAIAPYNVYVQRLKDQSRRHKEIGWPTPTKVVQSVWPKERKKIEHAVSKYKPRFTGG